MRLNANEFRKKLDDRRKQKKEADNNILRIRQELQESIEKKIQNLSVISSIALDAALNGANEVCLDDEHQSVSATYLKTLGFEIEEREVETDSLLRKVRTIPSRELKALKSMLKSELSKIIKISPPEQGTDLWGAHEEFKNAGDDLGIQVKFLLKVITYYDIAYRSNNYLSLEEDAKLWLYLSRLQDVISLFDPENDTEECIKSYLRWEDEDIDAEEVPDNKSLYSILNPNKLRFLNSERGKFFFAKISDEMTAKTEDLQSYIQFDLVQGDNGSRIIFRDESIIETPFSAQDLQLIFEKMDFKATWKFRNMQGNSIATFKVKF